MRRSWNGVQAMVAPVLARVSPSSRMMGPPKGFYKTTREFMSAQHGGLQASYHPLTKVQQFINEVLPLSIQQPVHRNFLDRVTYTIPEQFIVQIPGGRVLGENCLVITPDDKILGDVSRQFKVNEDFEKMTVFKTIKLPRITPLKGTSAVAGYAGGSYNYFHWTYDVLPRLLLLEKSGWLQQCDQVIINEWRMPFHEQSLKLLNLPVRKFIFSHANRQYEAENLVVPSVPDSGDFLPDWSLQALRERFVKGLQQPASASSSRIYISRKYAKKRRILNEPELVQLLTAKGFKVYYPENMTLAEQATLYEQAGIIVAPHGASQVNLLFCKPGATIIEIFARNWVNPCYWGLSNRLNLQYGYLIGQSDDDEQEHGVESDLTVNLDELQLLLNKASL